MDVPTGKKRVRDDSDDSALESYEAKRLRDDLLDFLDDADPSLLSQDLDSVMKSLQEEISAPVIDLTSDSGESQPQIGYLLEASDDELGLPTAGASSEPEKKNKEEAAELVRVSSGSSGIGEFSGFEDQIPSYDSFELGTGAGYNINYDNNNNNNNEFVAFDGLFDHSDFYYDSADFSEFSESRQHENMPEV